MRLTTVLLLAFVAIAANAFAQTEPSALAGDYATPAGGRVMIQIMEQLRYEALGLPATPGMPPLALITVRPASACEFVEIVVRHKGGTTQQQTAQCDKVQRTAFLFPDVSEVYAVIVKEISSVVIPASAGTNEQQIKK